MTNPWDYVRTAVRHRWWAALGFALLSAPVVAFTLLSTPVYQASTRLLIGERPTTPEVGRPAQGPEPQLSSTDAETLTQMVRNRALARESVAGLSLWNRPEFAPYVASATTDDERALALVDPFLSRLSAAVLPDSTVMLVSFESADPQVAAQAANFVASRFIERDRESRFNSAGAAVEWLNKRLAEQRQAVADAETALQTYRAQQDALSLSDRQNIVVEKLSDLNSSVTQAKTDRLGREAQYQLLQTLKGDPAALEGFPAIASNGQVQALKLQIAQLTRQDAELANRLGPKHPERVQVASALESTQQRLAAEIAKVARGVETEYLTAVAQEQSLTEALNQQKREALTLDRKGVQYAALEREAVSARQVYDALLQQTRAAAMNSDLQQSSIRVLDPAEPPGAPVRPRRGQGLAAASLLGLLGAAAGVIGREYTRRRVHSPQDLERHLGLPVLALMPKESLPDGDQAGGLGPLPAEAFRRLRANVMLACGDSEEPGKIIVVSSAAPGEGKTFVSSNLALALAAVDQRVALIDADLRRPRLHTAFGRQRAPGLADVLLGRRSIAEVLRPVDAPGLVLVPSGIPTAKASELLSNNSFRRFLEDLRSDFDWIVIDSPPVMAVSDASVLSREATAVLFVTSAEQTSLEAAETALDELNAAGANLIGAVLNRAPLTKEAFYYSRYYRPEYNAYLSPTGHEADEVEVAAREGVTVRSS